MISDVLKVAADPVNDWVWCVLLGLPRMMIIMQFWPVFSDLLQSQILKATAAMAMLALPSSYLFPQVEQMSLSVQGVARFALIEGVMGLILGMTLALPLFAVRSCGALVDVLRGATFSAMFNPASSDEELTLERLAGLAFSLYLLLTPFFLQAVELVLESYRIWPPSMASAVDFQKSGPLLLALFSDHLVWALRLVAPVLLVVLLVEVALYLISGYASSIQTYSVDAGLKGLVCLAMLLLLFWYAPDTYLQQAAEMTQQSLGGLKLLLQPPFQRPSPLQ